MKWLALAMLIGCVGDDEAPLEETSVTLGVASFNVCPRLVASALTPLTVAVGDVAEVSVEVTDQEPVTYAWTAIDGSFEDAAAASTTYTCVSAGDKVLTLRFADAAGCTRVAELTLRCITRQARA